MEDFKYHLGRLKGPFAGALIGLVIFIIIMVWLTSVSPYR